MKIAVNTRLLIANKLEGIGWFTYETLRHIVCSHPEHTFYFIFDRDYSEEFIFAKNVVPIITFPPTRHPYLWYIYFEYAIPYVLRKIKPDLFLSPDGWLSLRTDVPQIAVIHDINFMHNKEFLPPVYYKYYQKYFPQFAHKATRIATVSQYSKEDISQIFEVDSNKIDVVYNGYNACYSPLSQEDRIATQVAHAAGHEFFLFVSAIHKRKNLANILRAFDQFKEETQSEALFLVVGKRAGEQDESDSVLQTMKHSHSVRFLGRVSNETLAALLGSSIGLVYASLFEGFGIPILEAFAAGTAVITSNITAMPEVAGDAALLVNPQSVNEIARAMTQLATDETLRRQLIERGARQCEKFSWDITAKKLWECIEKGMQSHNVI